MNVVAEWSILEGFVSTLFVDMLGENPVPALSVYSSIQSTRGQMDALRAVAESILDSEECDALEAVLSTYKRASADRNRIAHWVWGHSRELPDAVLLCEPKAYAAHRAAVNEYTAKVIASAGRRPHEERSPFPDISRDVILVYRANDFDSASQQIHGAIRLVAAFSGYMHTKRTQRTMGGTLDGRAAEERQQLFAEPEVREHLDRLAERRKKSP